MELLPKNKPWKAMIEALLADEFLREVVGDRITFNPPYKQEFPLIFAHIVPPMRRKLSDDGSVLYYNEDIYFRLMADETWSYDKMAEVFAKIDEIILNFDAENILQITPNKNNIFFDSDTKHPYKSLEYGYEVHYR